MKMPILSWFSARRAAGVVKDWFTPSRESAENKTGDTGDNHARLWDAANLDRLNQTHWLGATGATLNSYMDLQFDRIRAHSEYEAHSNSIIEGMIHTHAAYLVGRNGPILNLVSDNREYNERAEKVWNDWWASPTRDGLMSGTELLHQAVWQWWTAGESLWQHGDGGRLDDGLIKKWVNPIHPRRLSNPPGKVGGNKEGYTIYHGVERDKYGVPIAYYIDPDIDASSAPSIGDYLQLSPRNVIHAFRSREPGQVRGVPWLASCLQVAADIRDYDNETLDAARTAAIFNVYFSTKDPTLQVSEVRQETTIERRTQAFLPPGYEVSQVKAEQPHTRYVDYREERHRDLGRGVGMPLMFVKLDARRHNYSSARFDGKVFERSNSVIQGWIERAILNRLVDMVMLEAMRAGLVPERPENLRVTWTWPKPDHVDEQKAASSATERLNNGTGTLMAECAANNQNWEDVVEQRKREKEALEAAGLPLNPAQAASGFVDQDEIDDDESDDTESGDDGNSEDRSEVLAYAS